jgi:hypothetical protein
VLASGRDEDGTRGLTGVDKIIIGNDSEGEVDEVQEEVSVVVNADAIVNPRAVTGIS